MSTRLYVANLPESPNVAALRAHFSACGIVSDVQIVAGRNPGRGQATAFVRMSSEAAARRALAELDRLPFEGQILSLAAAPADPGGDRRSSSRQPQQETSDPVARITMQFRESDNMAYELDCAGIALRLRVFFQTTATEWRIIAQAGSNRDGPSTDTTASSRLEALRNIARTSREGGETADLGRIDWLAVEQAMQRVRAV